VNQVVIHMKLLKLLMLGLHFTKIVLPFFKIK